MLAIQKKFTARAPFGLIFASQNTKLSKIF